MIRRMLQFNVWFTVRWLIHLSNFPVFGGKYRIRTDVRWNPIYYYYFIISREWLIWEGFECVKVKVWFRSISNTYHLICVVREWWRECLIVFVGVEPTALNTKNLCSTKWAKKRSNSYLLTTYNMFSMNVLFFLLYF